MEKQRLTAVAGLGRAPAQLYNQLSPEDLTALRDGQHLNFGSRPNSGRRSISPEIAAGIAHVFPTARVTPTGGIVAQAQGEDLVKGTPLTQHPNVDYEAGLWVSRSELGQFQLIGVTGFGVTHPNGGSASVNMSATLAEGISPSARSPKNAEVNAPLREMPEMQKKVSIAAKPSCELNRFSYPSPIESTTAKHLGATPMITTADALEAIHKTTGQDVIGDYYTRVYSPGEATVQGVTLFDALCNIADSLRLRWSQGNDWLGFRSVSFFYDRQKEIPHRQLERWATARKRNGHLTITELVEMAKLSKVQLDSSLLSSGVKAIYGLHEWDLLRGNYQRHLRFIASLPPASVHAILSPEGLPFSRLSYAEQQGFAAYMEHLPCEPEAIPGLTFKIRVTTPVRKKQDNTSAEAEPTKDEEWIAIKFVYTWVKDSTMMAYVQDNKSGSIGEAASIPAFRD